METDTVQDIVDYTKIGKEHNEGLDIIFDKLKALKDNGRLSGDQLDVALDEIEKNTLDFVLVNHPEMSAPSIEELKKQVLEMKTKLSSFSVSAKTNSDEFIHEQLLSDVQDVLTLDQKKYIDEILSVVVAGGDISFTLASLDGIEKNIRLNCSDEEQPVLLSAISIAKHSSQYWDENYSEWLSLFGESSSSNGRIQKINWGIVAAGDVAAGVATGVATSTLLVAPFIGWGAWAAITGGAALITSGGAIVAHYL